MQINGENINETLKQFFWHYLQNVASLLGFLYFEAKWDNVTQHPPMHHPLKAH
jgi:hypothetical protein